MNEKWFSLSASQIEKKLKTNAALGLSHKAARSRCKREKGSLFVPTLRPVMSVLGDIISDFSLIILAVMSLIALLFDERATGGVLVFVIALEIAVALAVCYKMEIFFSSLEKAFYPRSRVIRQGRLYLSDPERVVEGDVILLRAGDVLVCDARLVTSDSLKVRMMYERDKYVLLDKYAEGSVLETEYDVTKHVNVVHAGSTVVSGAARAIVTAVGRYTYIGARLGSEAVFAAKKRKLPPMLARLKKWFSSFSIILLISTLPFSLFSMLFGGDRLSLFSVFMTSLSLSALSMAMFAATLCKIFYAIPIRRCAMSKDSAIVRAPDALGALARVKYLFLLDGSALSDGILHFERAVLGDGEFSSEQAPRGSVSALSEAVALYTTAKKNALSLGGEVFSKYDNGLEDYLSKCPFDADALNIRCKASGVLFGNLSDPHDKIIYTDAGEKYILTVSYTDSVVSDCAYAIADGKRVPTNSAFLYSARETFKSFSELGKKVVIFSVARHEGLGNDAERCFIGMLILSEGADPLAEKAIASIERRGVKTVFFKNVRVGDTVAETSSIPSSIKFRSVADIRDFTVHNKPLSYGFREIDCYKGFSDEQVAELIALAHKAGDGVAVIGACEKYEKIYKAADLRIVASAEKYVVGDIYKNEIKVKENSEDIVSDEGSELARFFADISISRPDGERGGLSSLLNAFRAATMAVSNIWDFFRYLMVAQFMRIAIVRTAMVFGGAGVDSRHIFFIGVIADMLALFSFAIQGGVARKNCEGALEGVLTPLKAIFNKLIAFMGGAIVAVALPEILSLLPFMPTYIDRTEYTFVALVLLSAALFVSSKLEGASDKQDKMLVIIPIIILALGALCFLPFIARIFDIEGFSNIIYFLITPIIPIISFVLSIYLEKRKKN